MGSRVRMILTLASLSIVSGCIDRPNPPISLSMILSQALMTHKQRRSKAVLRINIAWAYGMNNWFITTAKRSAGIAWQLSSSIRKPSIVSASYRMRDEGCLKTIRKRCAGAVSQQTTVMHGRCL